MQELMAKVEKASKELAEAETLPHGTYDPYVVALGDVKQEAEQHTPCNNSILNVFFLYL